jgi:beta-phosphoglucomutase-like phosphatase (HAD superfamily)
MQRVIRLVAALAISAGLLSATSAIAEKATRKPAPDAAKAACQKLGDEVGAMFTEFERLQTRYLQELGCSIDAWNGFLDQREALLKVRGIAARPARQALADLDRRNAKPRASFADCQKARQGLRELIGRYASRQESEKEKLAACRKVFPLIRTTYEGDFRPLK